MSLHVELLRPSIEGESSRASAPATGAPAPIRLPLAEDRATPSRPHALATALAHSLNALEQRHARLLKCVADVSGQLAVALHGAALGNAVLQRLDLPPEARAIAVQQRRGLDLALASLARLRLAPEDARSGPPPEPARSGKPGPDAERALLPDDLHVLVIDDDASVRLATRLLLEMVGLDVRVAAGRDDALASVAAEPPDVVVADWNLAPGITGESLLHEIEDLCGRRLPGVIVSGDVCTPDPTGCRVVLQKPFGVVALLAALRRARADCVSAAIPVPGPAPAPT